MHILGEIEDALSVFTTISLDEMGKADLMRRKDCKYIFGVPNLEALLRSVKDHYRVLEINGIRSHEYETVYFDTPDREMYHMHHRGKANRYKVRFRRYGTSDIMFLEVKKKDAKGITVKNRIRTGNSHAEILTTEEAFLAAFVPYSRDRILPVMENRFNRITLVAHDRKERITLDYGLSFSLPGGGRNMEVAGLSIAEIKYTEWLHRSPFHRALRDLRIAPTRFSKYCIGTALLNPELKQNRFKEKIRRVHKINHAFHLTNQP